MNLLHLLGEHRRVAALAALVPAVVLLAVAGLVRWRSMENPVAASPPAAVARSTPRPTPPPARATASPAPSPAQAEATALAFCRQYFASSWKESTAQEQARVAPYLTARALSGWRLQLTPAQVAAHQTVDVTACSATDEGAAPGAQLGFFLDAQVVTTSTAGTQTQTAAAEVFLVPAAGAWKVEQVRA